MKVAGIAHRIKRLQLCRVMEADNPDEDLSDYSQIENSQQLLDPWVDDTSPDHPEVDEYVLSEEFPTFRNYSDLDERDHVFQLYVATKQLLDFLRMHPETIENFDEIPRLLKMKKSWSYFVDPSASQVSIDGTPIIALTKYGNYVSLITKVDGNWSVIQEPLRIQPSREFAYDRDFLATQPNSLAWKRMMARIDNEFEVGHPHSTSIQQSEDVVVHLTNSIARLETMLEQASAELTRLIGLVKQLTK